MFSSVFICAMRDADKEVFTGFANIAGVERAGFLDRVNLMEVIVHCRRDTLDLAKTTISTRPREYSATRSQNGRIFDEGRVREFLIRRQRYKFQPARFESFAVRLMLP